jgi:UDP-N-acetylglucosamine acyltransferase
MSATIQMLSHATDDTRPAIDERAVVSPKAIIGPGCRIGPLAVIGDDVRLGANCHVSAHSVVEGPTVMGEGNRIHPFACIGGPPQDKRHRDEPTELVIGEGNVFREYVTVNRGTVHGGGRTVVGDNNLFMAYSHIAHDCFVGDGVVLANHATVAGHTVIGDFAVFGGMAAVGTFLRIGESAMLAAGAMVEREVPPFCIVSGDRARLRAVNRVGLTRREFCPLEKAEIKTIFKALKGAPRSPADIAAELEAEITTDPGMRMIGFLKTVSRGLTR